MLAVSKRLDAQFGKSISGFAPMKNGLYVVRVMGLDRVDWPPNGVVVLRDGAIAGGGSYLYYLGTYAASDGIFKGELVINPHTPPPPNHLFYNAVEVGMGIAGTYSGDRAELTGTALVGKRSLAVRLTFEKLVDV
jgi:hypothetical protein